MIFYGFFVLVVVLCFLLALAFFNYKKDEYKWWRKHFKNRKKIMLWLAVFVGILLFADFESAFSPLISQVLWGIHAIFFVGYVGWSQYTMFLDYKRVKRAIARRK